MVQMLLGREIMKQLILLLACLLVLPVASMANGEDQCRNMNGQAFFQEWQEPCVIDDSFDFCIPTKIQGTINGSWVSFFQYEWLVVLEDLGVPTPPDSVETYYNREFEVFTSKQGEIWGDGQAVYDIRVGIMGGSAISIMVTGGTEMYEDAYGWITATILDPYFEHFSIDGRVCGPSIP